MLTTCEYPGGGGRPPPPPHTPNIISNVEDEAANDKTMKNGSHNHHVLVYLEMQK
jgi:hypothetical protein